ncbi:MAG: peptidylprolyl isomerase, partial [Gemmatimonadota bacterium]
MKLSPYERRFVPRAARYRAGAWRLVLGSLAVWIAAGCGGKTDYALQVGGTGFTARELGMLDPAQQARLADLTAFGLAVAQDSTAAVTAPYVQADEQALLLQKLAMEVAVKESGQDEDQLRRLYQQHPEYELTVRHLVIVSERWRPQAQRDSARAEAEAALARIRAGADFAKVASEVSQEPGAAESGGLLKPGRKGDWVPEFWAAASALRVGQVSNVVETQYGFHVIKLVARRPIPFEEVRSSVLPRLVNLEAFSVRAQAWAARQAEAVKLDTAAISGWRNGGPDSLTLASWPGGRLLGADVARYLLTRGGTDRERQEGLNDAGYGRV